MQLSKKSTWNQKDSRNFFLIPKRAAFLSRFFLSFHICLLGDGSSDENRSFHLQLQCRKLSIFFHRVASRSFGGSENRASCGWGFWGSCAGNASSLPFCECNARDFSCDVGRRVPSGLPRKLDLFELHHLRSARSQ